MTTAPPVVVCAPQNVDVPATALEIPGFSCLYATVRAADGQAPSDGAPTAANEDFVALIHGEGRLAFAVCDGVGQSFMPDIASALVGSALVRWLWSALDANDDVERIRAGVAGLLHGLAMAITPSVTALSIPAHLPPLVREALEEKRATGTQTTFAAGVLDLTQQRAVLTWLGDSRLRVWSKHLEESRALGDTFLTHERWSSREVIVGRRRPHVASTSLKQVGRIGAYSDGFDALDSALARPLSAAALEMAIAESKRSLTSDDASFVQIVLV